MTARPWTWGRAREEVLNLILLVLVCLAPIAITGSLARIPATGFEPVMVLHVIVGAVIIGQYLARRRLSFAVKAWTQVGIWLAVGIGGSINFGIWAGGMAILNFAVLLAAFLLGTRAGLITMALSLSTIVVTGICFLTGLLHNDLGPGPDNSLSWWLLYLLAAGLILLVTVLVLGPIQKRLEQASRVVEASEEQFRRFIEQSPDGIWCIVYDPPVPLDAAPEEQLGLIAQGRYVHCNQAFADAVGQDGPDKVIGEQAAAFATGHEESTRLIEAFIASGLRSVESELTARGSGGRQRHHRHSIQGTHENGHLVRTWGMITDLTELREMEAELRHRQKLDAIGQLAGGVAHDFNNVLGGILGAAELIRIYGKDTPKVIDAADIIASATERAKGLTQKLLAYSRKGMQQIVPFDVHTLVNEVCTILERTIDPSIHVTNDLQAPEHTICGDPTALHSALLNLCINARDAMPDGGRLEIRSHNRTLDRLAAIPLRIDPGTYLCIEIEDTGIGIAPDIRERIFEPFFTTKAPGKGTGLGLSAVFGILGQHKGSIDLQSTPGQGSRFTLYLPVTGQSAEPKRDTTIPSPGAGRILVVDDDEAVRESTCSLLEELGFQTIQATDGYEAIKTYCADQASFQLVLLDLTMPHMNGEECLKRLRTLDPDVPIIISSGFFGNQTLEHLQAHAVAGILNKPYSQQELNSAVQAAVGASESDDEAHEPQRT